MLELKPCPFCAEDTELSMQNSEDFEFAIRCNECGALGPWSSKREQATTFWNYRKVKEKI